MKIVALASSIPRFAASNKESGVLKNFKKLLKGIYLFIFIYLFITCNWGIFDCFKSLLHFVHVISLNEFLNVRKQHKGRFKFVCFEVLRPSQHYQVLVEPVSKPIHTGPGYS